MLVELNKAKFTLKCGIFGADTVKFEAKLWLGLC